MPLLIGGAVFADAADVYDTRETQIGLRHGVAVEGNTWLIGSHPSFRAGVARDQIMIGVSLIAPTLGWVKRWPLLFGGTLNEPYIIGIKHIKAGNAWRKLLADQSSVARPEQRHSEQDHFETAGAPTAIQPSNSALAPRS